MLAIYITTGIIVGAIVILFNLAIFIHHRIFGKRWDPDGIVAYYSPKDYSNILEENVEIPTKKGKLRGKLYSYPIDQYKGILVFSHGMWGSHKAYFQEMELLARNGYKVLGIDAYGTESSDGKNIKGLGNSLLTLDKAICYIRVTYPNEKIYVMGHSWGGFAAANIAKYHKDITAIVAMSPFLSVAKILKHQLPKLLYPTIPFLVLLDRMHCGKYSFAHAKKTLKNTSVPTLILHSKDDPMVPYLTATGLLQKKIHNPNVTYYIVDGKKHNPDYTIEALAYTQEAFAKLKTMPNEEDKLEYRKNLDYHKMGELDEKVFAVILDFLKLQ
ncbi:MAG: lysophospholipase [Anaeroplasmataceae bacterium]|nr:lysophospholipase [Anaeroplasmataceae bacterium]MDE6414667.1 lysophospholipase [Anaeroplasmataceae bacterium]